MINHKPEDEEENVAIVKSAFDHGVNFFDTAENY
jgi:aryl-alcohol dehydrogenase-like predicted oxidoreductase